MTEAKTTLLDKLHTAQQAAGPVGKAGRNEHQKYNYARAEDVIREAQGALHGAGLVGAMTFNGAEEREVVNSKGTPGIYITLAGALRISDPASGEVFEVPTFGAGIDYPGDKAVYKAMTGAAKYAYASALGIPFTDDPENDSPDNARARQDADAEQSQLVPDAATKAQKGAITRRCTELKITDEQKPLLIEWAGGMPLTKGRAGKLIDLLKNAPNFDTVWRAAEIPNPNGGDDGTAQIEHDSLVAQGAEIAVTEPGGAEALGLTEHDE